MGAAVTAADANRTFSSLLRQVRDGRSYIVTSHGRPVARVVPFRENNPVRTVARTALFARLRAAPVRKVGAWTRDDLYD